MGFTVNALAKELVDFPGFFVIDGLSRYAININGDLITVEGRPLRWSILAKTKDTATGGYRYANLFDDKGERHGVSRHRLLMRVFSEYDFDPASMWVNHKNGRPGDDRLSNLEWVTPGQNVQHAYDTGLYKNKTVSVDCLNWKTGESFSFDSIAAASRAIDFNHTKISSRLRRGNENRYADGWRFKYSDSPWKELNSTYMQGDSTTDVAAINVITGKVVIFGSMFSASQFTGIDKGTISAHCQRETKRAFKGWLFRYLSKYLEEPKTR